MTQDSSPEGATAARGARFCILGVGPHLVALDAGAVQEMFVLPPIHRLPGSRPHQRGVAALRAGTLPAVDLRVCLGLPSATAALEELLQLLRDREQDHLRWLAELTASVREDRAFGLATDPRKCKFGQWYYAFRTDDAVLRGELERFEKPHAAIHALADEVAALRTGGRAEEALQVLERARQGLLAELVRLFEQLRDVVRAQHREIGVAIAGGGRSAVAIVDRAEAVTDLTLVEGDDPLEASRLGSALVTRTARWAAAKQPVFVLDAARLAAGDSGRA
ncbi:CZB domain-containing protein [Anaeromyxobacter diazotrophicus]|uniref:Chemoreceptor zinc-binding domain-containing protein n=1 Tax=Anaeromyxobacter diazotrophicus TaxID=2590199 RepID=A0A7I9VIJ3_9BACT|nr:CZB domain-containing protein [Anaeromyxobacter diazotrophicus]GEJ56224.1 hypothetical protein AMYX_09650 [Anaeromyxobacter diazotrophicus]